MAKNKTKLRILCHNANDIHNDRLVLHELLHSLDIDIALICEIKLPTWFEGRNLGYRIYDTRFPNFIHGGIVVLVKANIQDALVKIPMLNPLQATAIMVKLNIGAVY